MNTQTTDDSLAVIQEVFRGFRTVLLQRAGNSTYHDKIDGSPVTDSDVEVELALKQALTQRCPGVPIFGEEAGYDQNLPIACWLVDPIDGTSSFVAGTPSFTNMAVLIEAGQATASVIYNPSSDEMFVARQGQGALKNGNRLNLQVVPLPKVAYSKSQFALELSALLKPSGVTCGNGPEGGGYGFTLVADGLAAARFNLLGRGQIHDYAPGALLVREAGGAIIPVATDTYAYDSRSFIACHPDLEQLLRSQATAIRAMEIG